MNNEEKILAMLVEMKEDLAAVKATQAKQGEQLAAQGEQLASQGKQLAALTGKVDSLADKVDSLEGKVDGLEEKIDSDVVPYVKLLDDDYSRIGRRVTALEKAN